MRGPERHRRPRPVLVAWAAVGVLATVGCGDEPTADDPAARAVRIETEGCGHAADSSGMGIVIDDDRVLTVAHLIAGSSEVAVVLGDEPIEAEVLAYDPARDLALLGAPGMRAAPIDYASLSVGDLGTIVGAAAGVGSSAAEQFSVLRHSTVEIDVVRSSETATREAYEVDSDTTVGDSGSGAFDENGRLVGVVFAISRKADDRTWVTTATEVRAFLADEATRGSFSCDEDGSRLEAVG